MDVARFGSDKTALCVRQGWRVESRGLPATLDSRLRGNDEGGGNDNAAPRRLGVDVARFGSDKTALCVRQGWRVESLRSFERVDTMRTG